MTCLLSFHVWKFLMKGMIPTNVRLILKKNNGQTIGFFMQVSMNNLVHVANYFRITALLITVYL